MRKNTISQTTATLLCKLGKFLWQCSYETAMSSLLVITIQRFFAVVFPMRARQKLATRTETSCNKVITYYIWCCSSDHLNQKNRGTLLNACYPLNIAEDATTFLSVLID